MRGQSHDGFTSMCLQGSHGSTAQSQACNELNLKLCPSSLCSGAGNASRSGLWKSRVSRYRILHWAGAPVETISFLVVALSKDEEVRLSCQPGDECLEGAVAGALERDSWEGD